jgi:hypothetical protein
MLIAALAKYAIHPLLPAALFHNDIHGVASYLEVLGGIYSLVIAFVIYVTWDQYNRVQTGITQEASALEDLCRVASFLSNRDACRAVRTATRQYIESTSGDELRRLAEGQSSRLADERFHSLCLAVRGVEVKTEKDEAIFDELLRALIRVSDARDARLTVSATRVPPTLWNLVVFASVALIGGFLALGIASQWAALAVTAAAAGVLTFLLSVIKDMDNPFVGVWNVSYEAMRTIGARLGQM